MERSGVERRAIRSASPGPLVAFDGVSRPTGVFRWCVVRRGHMCIRTGHKVDRSQGRFISFLWTFDECPLGFFYLKVCR